MENLNRVELRGTIGSIHVSKVGDTAAANITVATNLAYLAKDGTPVIETTWHRITAFEGKNISGLENIKKGDKVYIQGRLRYQHYTAQDGSERAETIISASRLVPVESEEALKYELI